MENTTKNESETEHSAVFDFESAKSLDEMVEAVKNMVSCLQEKELDFVRLKMEDEFDTEGESPEKIFTFGESVLTILDQNANHHASIVFSAYVLNCMGCVSFELKRYDESLSYLNCANSILCKLEHECDCVFETLVYTQLGLHRVKTGTGKKEEAVAHLVKVLSIKEKTMDEGCVELGEANMNVSRAYQKASNFKAALPFGLKALEIYTKHFGDNSLEIAEIKGFLGFIYSLLGEDDKALELNQSSMSVLKDVGHTSDAIVKTEVERGQILIANGKFEEAMKCLKAVVSNSEVKEADRGMAFVNMAGASFFMQKFEKARKYLKIAHEILEKKETDPNTAVVGFWDMSSYYKMMGDYETALSLLRRVLQMPELHQKHLVDVSTRLFSLISLAGKEKKGIRYLEDVVEILRKRLGPEHCEVGYCYANLAMLCWKAGSKFRAKNYYTLAKDVMDVSVGPNHLDSLKTSQSLSIVYLSIKRYDEAIAIQENVVQGLRGRVPSEQAFLEEAVELLDRIKDQKNSWCNIL